MTDGLTFAWSHGEGAVSLTAGMLTDCVFDLEGRRFAPFATAPWSPGEMPDLPGHLRVLGAEFVCLPFGEGGSSEGMVDEWTPLVDGPPNRPPHGLPADEEWRLHELRDDGLTLRFEFPPSHDLLLMERRIDGIPGEPGLRISLVIVARRPVTTSLGLHPIVRLPERPRALRIEADFEVGYTYPAPVPPGCSSILPGRRFDDLTAVPTTSGFADLSRVPFDVPAEEVVQLAGARAPVRVHFEDEGAGVEIDWDRSLLPSVQLWLSDRALPGRPWNGRYRGVGIEPIASAFDLSEATSVQANPISAAGHATSIEVSPERPVRIEYELRAFMQK